MKNNILKKAASVFLAAALVTTGMPLQMMGAGTVKADALDPSPSGVNLAECTAKAKVSNKIYYPHSLNDSEVIVSVLGSDGSVVAKGTIAALRTRPELFKGAYLEVGYGAMKGAAQTAGSNKSGSFELYADDSAVAVKGKTTVLYDFNVEKAYATKVTMQVVGQTALSPNTGSTVVGGTGFVKGTVRTYDGPISDQSTQSKQESDAKVSYSVVEGSDCLEVDSSTGEFKAKKAGTAYVKGTCAGTDNYDAATSDLFKITIGQGTGEFDVANKKITLTVGESQNISVSGANGEVTYTLVDADGSSTEVAPTNVTLSDSKVTAKNVGPTAYVKVTDSGSSEYSPKNIWVAVDVVDNKSNFKLSQTSVSIYAGNSVTVAYTTSSNGAVTAENKKVEVASVGANDVTGPASNVGGIKITGNKVGTAKIVVRQAKGTDATDTVSYGSAEQVIDVTVTGKESTFTVTPPTTNVQIGSDALVIPYSGAVGSVSFATSEDSVGAVSVSVEESKTTAGEGSLKVLGAKKGEVKLTVTDAGNGVDVPEVDVPLTLTVTGTSNTFAIPYPTADVKVGQTGEIAYKDAIGEVTATPALGSTGEIQDLAVADGKITFKGTKAGTVTLSVVAAGNATVEPSGNVTATINVGQDASEFEVEDTKAKVAVNGTTTVNFMGAAGNVTTEVVAGTGNVTATNNKFKVTITGTKPGTAIVKVTDEGTATKAASTKEIEVTVNANANNFSLAATTGNVNVGKTIQIQPKNNKGTVTYKSADASIATVSAKGVVTGKKAGTVKITVADPGNNAYAAKSLTFTATVKKVSKTQTLTVTAAKNPIGVGETTTIKVTGAQGTKHFSSSKASVASVDANGKVTAKATGTAKISVYADAKGDYAKSATKTVTITVKALPKATISSLKSSAAKTMTVKWKKQTLGTGYQIQYSTNKNFKSGNKTVKVTKLTTVSKKITKLTSKKTYYVRVRTYAGSKYGTWSAKKSVKVK